jgi:hypothetical protein
MDWNALIPQEIGEALQMSILGFPLWQILIVALILPTPIMMVLVLFFIPGVKEKVIQLSRNGVSGLYSDSSTRSQQGG